MWCPRICSYSSSTDNPSESPFRILYHNNPQDSDTVSNSPYRDLRILWRTFRCSELDYQSTGNCGNPHHNQLSEHFTITTPGFRYHMRKRTDVQSLAGWKSHFGAILEGLHEQLPNTNLWE